MAERSWWRRNRWALLTLPLVLVAVALSGLGRVTTFWWPYQVHDRVEGTAGEFTAFQDDYRDAGGDHDREVEVAVGEVVESAQFLDGDGLPVPDELVPPGLRLWEVEVTVRADPKVPLGGCIVALVDARERVAQRDSTLMPYQVGFDACQPQDTVNPQAQLFVDEAPHEPSTRPPEWSRTIQLLTSEDFEPVEVRLWWEPPTYLAVPLPAVAP